MLYTFFIMIWTVIVTVFFSLLVIAGSFVSSGGDLPHKIARIWAKSFLMVSRIRVNRQGLSRITPGKPYIFMCNHQSNFDIPVLLANLPVQFRWLAKSELFKIPIFGYAMKRAGYISIDRSNRRTAIQSLKRAAEIIRNGVSVMIFPEGTRSQDGTIRPFKKGGFVLAIEAGVPVVPVILHGTWAIMSKNGLRIRPGRVTLEIRDPIETSRYTRKNKEAFLEDVRAIISQSFDRGERDAQ